MRSAADQRLCLHSKGWDPGAHKHGRRGRGGRGRGGRKRARVLSSDDESEQGLAAGSASATESLGVELSA